MLQGTATIDELSTHAARIDGFDTAEEVLDGVELVQATFQISVAGRQAALPPGLHPTNPPIFVVQGWRCATSPWGPLQVVQGRVGARSGLRPRGLVQGCVVDNPEAAADLARRWGYPARLGSIRWERAYHQIELSAEVDGVEVVAVRALDPVPLGPADVTYSTTVALADTPRGWRLVQIDTDVDLERAERLRPQLTGFATGSFVHPVVRPIHPIAATVATGRLVLRRLRYLCRPEELAFGGTETLAVE